MKKVTVARVHVASELWYCRSTGLHMFAVYLRVSACTRDQQESLFDSTRTD